MRKAAVLMLLVDDGELSIVLTERAAHLRKHAGQISFPGGSRDGRETPEQTALRETYEECGIDAGGVRVLGRLPASSLPVTAFSVVPVVGVWEGGLPLEHAADPEEVAATYTVPVNALADPANRGIWRWRAETDSVAGVSAGAIRHEGPAFVRGELVIWGFTAMLLDGLLELAGWDRPWDRNRVIDVPTRFGGRA